MRDLPALTDVLDLAHLGEGAERLTADLHEEMARDRATAQAQARLPRRPFPLPADAGACMIAVTLSPTCVRDARAYARLRCAEQHVTGERCDALELAMSELVGNAVRHGRPPVAYDVAADGDDLVLIVTDGDPSPPGDGDACDPDDEGGRGLLLTAACRSPSSATRGDRLPIVLSPLSRPDASRFPSRGRGSIPVPRSTLVTGAAAG
jgi:hypothetical protein